MIRRWLLFLILLLPIPFAVLFILLLPSGFPPAEGIAPVNAALACLALVGIAVVLAVASRRFHRQSGEG